MAAPPEVKPYTINTLKLYLDIIEEKLIEGVDVDFGGDTFQTLREVRDDAWKMLDVIGAEPNPDRLPGYKTDNKKSLKEVFEPESETFRTLDSVNQKQYWPTLLTIIPQIADLNQLRDVIIYASKIITCEMLQDRRAVPPQNTIV